MERMMSVEEKIRRAEEIYNRKKENENNRQTARVSVESRPNKSILKKMRNQILVCITIYFVFYFIINGNYTFSQSVKEKVNEVLEYDISLNTIYTSLCDLWNNISSKINEISNGINNSEEQNEQENAGAKQESEGENATEDVTQSENEADTKIQDESIDGLQTEEQNTNDNNSETSNGENIGGSTEEQLTEENSLSEEDQMQKDAEEIKSSISFIKPISGTITSRFGWRNPTVSTVPKYHTGLDIGAVQGTEIKSATNGKVTLVSSEGDLRESC